MDAFDDLARRGHTTLGYYSRLTGAHVVSPFSGTNTRTELVENHEFQHKYLSDCNVLDRIAWCYEHLLRNDRARLRPPHKEAMELLVSTIYSHTSFVHEAFATYASLFIYSLVTPADVQQARKRLPSFYENAVASVERAFGALDLDAGADRRHAIFPMLMGAAIAALNVDCRPFSLGTFELESLARFVAANSPDERFRRILNALGPFDRPGILSDTLREVPVDAAREGEATYTRRQRAFYRRLGQVLPDLRFLDNHQDAGNAWFRANVAQLQHACAAVGYSALEGLPFQNKQHEHVHEEYGASVVIAGMEPSLPLDTSLVAVEYRPSVMSDFSEAASACVAANAYIYAHLIPTRGRPQSLSSLRQQPCLCQWFVAPSRLMTMAAAVSLSEGHGLIADADTMLSAIPRNAAIRVVMKIDERMAPSDIGHLTADGINVVVLLHDTTPRHVIENLEELSRRNMLDVVCEMGLGNASLRVLIAVCQPKRLFYMSVVTPNSAMIVNDYCEQSPSLRMTRDAVSALGTAFDFMPGVALTAYMLPVT